MSADPWPSTGEYVVWPFPGALLLGVPINAHVQNNQCIAPHLHNPRL